VSEYTCPGRDMPQPPAAPAEGYVACYRAGHSCPPKVAIRTELEDGGIKTVYRCPCCGDFGGASFMPASWLHPYEVVLDEQERTGD
jgi:hypothetical protein